MLPPSVNLALAIGTANTYSTQIVMRSRSQQALDAAYEDIEMMLKNFSNA